MEEERTVTNDEYRERINAIIEGINDNRILRYYYIILQETSKEWNG